MIGLEKGTVKLAKYNSAWEGCFDEEKERILKAVHTFPLAVEHVGSTAIAGLSAKPIIDILIGLEYFNRGFEMVEALESIGYEYKGENGIAGRHFFAKGNPRTHHLHVVEKGSDFWTEHLLFRDFLRQHALEREQYETLKKNLATLYPLDREKYTDAKADFIREVIDKAKREIKIKK